MSRVNKEKKVLVRCSSVFLMFDVKKVLNLIVSLNLLYLVLCSIPYFHVIFYMFFVIYVINQFGDIQHIPQLSDLSVVSYEYGLVDIDISVVGYASKFWEACRSSIDFPLCSRDDQEWFSTEFRVWRHLRDPIFVFDLSLPVLTDTPLLVDILRDYT